MTCCCRNGLALLLLLVTTSSMAETLTIWCNRGRAALMQSAARYHERTGVDVRVEAPVNMIANFQIQAPAGAGPDILCWGHDRIGEWVNAGLLAPVAGADTLSRLDIPAWTHNAVSVAGQPYGYPLFVETLGLIYNPALVSVPPADFDELPQVAAQLPEGVYALGWPWRDAYYSWPLMAGPTRRLFATTVTGDVDARQPQWAAPEVALHVEQWQQWSRAGVITPDAEIGRLRAWFARGQLAMLMDGPWLWRDLDRGRTPWRLAPLPTWHGQPVRPFVGVYVAMINSLSPRRDVATDFLENHLLTAPELQAWAASGELGALVNDALARPQSMEPHLALLLAEARRGHLMPNDPVMAAVWTNLETALDNMASGRMRPREALDAAARRIMRQANP